MVEMVKATSHSHISCKNIISLYLGSLNSEIHRRSDGGNHRKMIKPCLRYISPHQIGPELLALQALEEPAGH